MGECVPENLQLLYSLSRIESEKSVEEMSFICRRIMRTPKEQQLQDKKHRCALEEILEKKQRIIDID